MRNINNHIIIIIAAFWLVISMSVLVAYASSKLGPTPAFLPIIFVLISFVGVLICIWFLYAGRITKLSFVASLFLYFIAIFYQLKHYLKLCTYHEC